MSILISSKYRDRIQYQNPCSFTLNTSSQSLSDTIIPVTNNYPIYNFSFCHDDSRFPCSILSLVHDTLILHDDIFSLIGKATLLNSEKLSFVSTEDQFHILKGLFIEITIADTIFSREIVQFDPIEKKITIKNPFPFVMNESSPIECFISNRSTSLEITANGNFFQSNDFLYNKNDIILYNIRNNEFRKVISRQENVLKLETSFSSIQINDQYLVFYTANPPKITGDFLLQTNQNYLSEQYGRLQTIVKGSGYKNNFEVILKPLSEAFDSGFSYHKYSLKKVHSSLGELENVIENLELKEIGSDQQLKINTQYEVYTPNGETQSNCIIKILSLTSLFSFESTENINLTSLEKKYFMPLIMSNQYVVKDNSIYNQPNNSILNYDDGPMSSRQRNLTIFEDKNGVFEIQKAFLLSNGKYAITTRYINNNQKFTLMKEIPDLSLPIYQGIRRFLILGEIEDSETPLQTNNLSKLSKQNYSIQLDTVVIPNLNIKNTDLMVYQLPYLLLNLKNKTQASNLNQNNIHSNNKFVSKNKFILTIDKDNIDETTEILKLSSEIPQEILFDPFDNMDIEISLPNGHTLEFEKKEHMLPIIPNDKIEIVILLKIISSV
jgi:hypothetical protein